MKECFQTALDSTALAPGMITWIHSAGKVLNFHPHVHSILSTGCFDKDGAFYHILFMPEEEKLEKLFMHKALGMMMEKDRINEDVVEKLMSWTNSIQKVCSTIFSAESLQPAFHEMTCQNDCLWYNRYAAVTVSRRDDRCVIRVGACKCTSALPIFPSSDSR